jgi:hypothetical protein
MYWSASTSRWQTGDLGPVGLEQDHRRIAAHLEACAEFLRALGIEINRNEETRTIDEILAIENRCLDLIAGRAQTAPSTEHRLFAAFAAANAVSTSPCQAMPASAGAASALRAPRHNNGRPR